MRDEVEQQLQSLRAELESIEGQKMQAETEPYTAQLEQITLMLQEANRQLEVFKNDYEKIKILYENGAVSKAELENQERAIEQQENIIKQHEKQIELLKEQHTLPEGTEQYFEGLKDSIRTQIKFLERRFAQLKGNATGGTSEYFESQDKSIEYQIKQLESKLSKAEVIAPIDGIIKGVKIEQGMVIPEAMELFTIFQPNSYQIETMVHMEEVMDINEGMPVKIIMDRRDEDILFSGTIVEIAPSAIETISPLGLEERRVKVTIVPDEFDVKLRPGYALDVEFTTITEKDVLAVPKTALFPLDENTDAVWVEKDGRARIQPIEKGLETTDEVVIKKGLEDGDIVITNPQFEGLKEGVRIRY